MFGNFYFLWVYLLNLKCVSIVRRPESHLPIHLPLFYHLNSENLQYSISFSIEHIVLILILNVQYSIFNISNQYLILITALRAVDYNTKLKIAQLTISISVRDQSNFEALHGLILIRIPCQGSTYCI